MHGEVVTFRKANGQVVNVEYSSARALVPCVGVDLEVWELYPGDVTADGMTVLRGAGHVRGV